VLQVLGIIMLIEKTLHVNPYTMIYLKKRNIVESLELEITYTNFTNQNRYYNIVHHTRQHYLET